MDLCEMHTFEPIVTFSWFIIQTSSPIQQSSPISRFHGKCIRTLRRMMTRRPILAPKKRRTHGLRDDGKSGSLKIRCWARYQFVRRNLRKNVKPVLPVNAFRSRDTQVVYFWRLLIHYLDNRSLRTKERAGNLNGTPESTLEDSPRAHPKWPERRIWRTCKGGSRTLLRIESPRPSDSHHLRGT